MAREYHMRRDPETRASETPIEDAKLTDESPMPFGKYGPKPRGEGRIMKRVPPGYLLFIWDVDDGLWLDGPFLNANQKALRAYILESFKALEMDCPDFNIKHHPDKMERLRVPRPPTFSSDDGHRPF